MDAAIEEAISRVTQIEEAYSSLSDFIISITVEEQPVVSLAQAATQPTIIKSSIITLKVSSKRKGYNLLEVIQHQKCQNTKEQRKLNPKLLKLL